ncbi:hypothetical protein JEQ12_010926 [Ovis aries]|uniref:Uncharacterized protein n=1 Tax=Ovis aries TaxID=9940 RepID=A0A836CRJ5_SHEEP|nr:hypothetical protein JEQ12_010926 [Ovis aries]
MLLVLVSDHRAWWDVQTTGAQRKGHSLVYASAIRRPLRSGHTRLGELSQSSSGWRMSKRIHFTAGPSVVGLACKGHPAVLIPIPFLSPEALQAERQLSYGNDGCAAQLFFSLGAERKKKEKTQAKHQKETLLTVFQGLLQAENRNQALWSSSFGKQVFTMTRKRKRATEKGHDLRKVT